MNAIADGEMGSIVLNNIINNTTYASKVLPYLSADYFVEETECCIAQVLIDYHSLYGKSPNVREIVVELKELPQIIKLDKNTVNDVLGNGAYIVTDNEWLTKHTEKFIQRRRIGQAFEKTYGDFEAGNILDSIANVFQEALSFSFDNSIGHNFILDSHLRYDLYCSEEERISFYLEMMDLVTGGGVGKGTLNVFLAGTGVGKSLLMCSIAAAQAMAGKKVLYISLEMAELKLAERLESNLMDVPLNSLKHMSKEDFTLRQNIYIKKMDSLGGNIIFKQYPTSSAHAGHFRNLLIECKNKLDLDFDVIYIDYLNICATNRGVSGDNSYTKVKNIAEEVRALAVEFQVPIISATQTNRSGQESSDLSFDDVSESHGLSATVDLLFGLMSNEEWEKTGKVMVGQIKNRYGDLNYYKKFMIGVERSKMRLYDLKREASNEVNVGQSSTTNSTKGADFGAIDLSVLGNARASSLNFDKLKT